jgi:hypothetical protein
MTFWTVAEEMADRFPELKADLENHILGYWEMNIAPYPHEFLESYLLPLLVSAEPEDRTRRAYGFLEDVLRNQDEDLVGAGVSAVLEPIVENPKWFDLASKFMGARSAELAKGLRLQERG